MGTTSRTRRWDASRRPRLDARPDAIDFRDRLYEPTLVEVPMERPLDDYKRLRVPVLAQGAEGACTGFALATVANYLLRRREVRPDRTAVSPRMLYEMARRYDEWPGDAYEGSSARGAIKGWHKHGVCGEGVWPYRSGELSGVLTDARARDAAERPLGAYYRVNHRDLVALHAALAEVGVLCATAEIHAGWDEPDSAGRIPLRSEIVGGHAFALVGYDRGGFWIQNSWSADWGVGGFAWLSYDDWLAHGTDVWAARLGAPVALARGSSAARARASASGSRESLSQAELRPHVVSLGNDGALRASGSFGTTPDDVAEIFANDLPRVTAGWPRKRILLWAHGGLVREKTALQRMADLLPALLAAQIYPIALVWKSDYWSTLENVLRDALARRRPEGALAASTDFMLDRLDDLLEPLARTLSGKATWDELKENALLATEDDAGGARVVLDRLAGFARSEPATEIHMIAHSAGSVLLAPVVSRLAGDLGTTVESCTLWAPSCTTALFKQHYLPAVRAGTLRRFALFTLGDRAERDDHVAHVYHKSLLYLVSNALEDPPRIPLLRPEGVPLLGLARSVEADRAIKRIFDDAAHVWVQAPNDVDPTSGRGSQAMRHNDFDDDEATLRSTLRFIRNAAVARGAELAFQRSASRLRELRRSLDPRS